MTEDGFREAIRRIREAPTDGRYRLADGTVGTKAEVLREFIARLEQAYLTLGSRIVVCREWLVRVEMEERDAQRR